MKTRTMWILILSNLVLLVVLFPWWEIVVGCVALLLFFIYLHYWVDKATYGPYLYYGTDVASEIVVNWIGVSEKYHAPSERTTIQVSESRNFADSNYIKEFECSKIRDLEGRRYYHYKCSGLSANTTYYYRIMIDEHVVFDGPKYHFTMGPLSDQEADSISDHKIIIYGDDQTADWIPVMALYHNHFMYKEDPSMIIHLGDINQRIFRQGENNAFWTTKRQLFRTIPYMPVIGNHDYPIVQYPPPDDAWKFYDAFYDVAHYYAFDYGCRLTFICINNEESLAPNSTGQYEFIEKVLKRTVEEDRFAIICGHASPYNIQTHVNPKQTRIEQVKEHLVPLLKKYNKGLQRNILYFAGHMHTYERIIKDDVTYITVGACSNAKYYSQLEPNDKDELRVDDAEEEYGGRAFAVLTLKDRNLIVTIQKMFGKNITSLKFSL